MRGETLEGKTKLPLMVSAVCSILVFFFGLWSYIKSFNGTDIYLFVLFFSLNFAGKCLVIDFLFFIFNFEKSTSGFLGYCGKVKSISTLFTLMVTVVRKPQKVVLLLSIIVFLVVNLSVFSFII